MASAEPSLAGLLARYGPDAVLGVRPEAARLSADEGLRATLRSADYRGADTIVTAEIGGQAVAVRVPGRVAVEGGETGRLVWRAEDVRIFDGRSRRLEHAGGTERCVAEPVAR
jgi:sn-glycerol 3-phosphate transport system ATP-binding protein